MSRTIRRKGKYPLTARIGLPEDIDSYDMERFSAKTVEQCFKKKKARFHSDSHPGVWSPPSWFCRVLNRRASREDNEDLHRCLVSNEWDDHLPVRQRRGAGYIWW